MNVIPLKEGEYEVRWWMLLDNFELTVNCSPSSTKDNMLRSALKVSTPDDRLWEPTERVVHKGRFGSMVQYTFKPAYPVYPVPLEARQNT